MVGLSDMWKEAKRLATGGAVHKSEAKEPPKQEQKEQKAITKYSGGDKERLDRQIEEAETGQPARRRTGDPKGTNAGDL